MDAETYETLYLELHRALFAFARASVGADEARDVVSETFEVVWLKRRHAPEGEALRQWCFGIARNKVLQAKQRRVRKHHDHRFAADHAHVTGPSAPDIAECVVSGDAARAMWEALSERDQELLAVLMTSDDPPEANAAKLGTSYTAYMSRVWRIRKRLHQTLGSATDDPGRSVQHD